MKLEIRPGNRWCVVEKRARFSLSSIRGEILRHENINERFTLLGTPAPARDQTLFKAYTDGKDLLVAVAVFDSVAPTTRMCPVQRLPNRHSVEIFFAPWNDELGWFQFCFQPDGRVETFNHLPYPEAHATSMAWLKVRRFCWEDESKSVGLRLYWLFAWFPLKQVFRNGERCGFNVARSNPPIEEYSSWNHTSAVGTQDATCFGKLYLNRAPESWRDVHADLQGNRVVAEGRISKGLRNFRLELVNPIGEKLAMTTRVKEGRFRALATLGKRIPGCYRLCPAGTGVSIEPEDYSFDLTSRDWARQFRFSVTYDIPDNICEVGYLTPKRLRREMEGWKEWGIQRIYWIEYGPLSRWGTWWDQVIAGLAKKNSGRNDVALTRKHCDNLILPGARWAKRQGMEFFGVFKPFDMGINPYYVENDGQSCVREIEERYTTAMPEVAAHPELLMRRHPEWRRREVFPITRLVFYSENPIPSFTPSKLSLWTSRDNLHYTKYRKSFRVTQGAIRRPHYRWTPAGKVAESESIPNHPHGVVNHPHGVVNWRIEISNLNLDAPFLALEIEGQNFTVSHRAFAFAEAWSEGKEAPVTLSSGGDHKKGFILGKGVWSWANHTATILDVYSWKSGPLGMVFREEEGPSNLLEPSYAGARKIWLERIRAILESDADGVDIRTLGFHSTTMSHLAHAFAEPVREAFRKRYGRPVEPTHEDYTRVRKLRGEAYTQFLREAKALATRYRKKLSAHLEWGVEVPHHLDNRMAMDMDWRTWIGEKIVDEVSLRGWASQNSYVHRHILPLARRMKVPMHIISRCLAGGLDLRAMEVCERYVMEACAAGCSGFSLYQTSNILRMNPEGYPMPVGLVDEALRKARCALDRLETAPL
ncbi:MAG: hypothetical protein HY360_04880 [Verrucomicrobia bacterium]|nr:hypothetical protein [Verrucomicrobiota bacterium]